MIHTETEPRRSALDRATAARLAATEYGRYLDLLRSLGPDDWARPTDCPAWAVRAMAAHNLGMAEMVASPEEQQRQAQTAARRGGVYIDALTGLQVEERAAMTSGELIARYAEVSPRAARGRAGAPEGVRVSPMPLPQTVNRVVERWSVGFLLDTVLTRDTWMHRIDTARATGRAPELTADHDGVLVADIVAEWAERHAGSCALTLTGPAGGRWTFGSGDPELELDAVEFARVLSGRRSAATRLPLDTEIPF